MEGEFYWFEGDESNVNLINYVKTVILVCIYTHFICVCVYIYIYIYLCIVLFLVFVEETAAPLVTQLSWRQT